MHFTLFSCQEHIEFYGDKVRHTIWIIVKIIALKHGHLVLSGNPSEFMQAQNIREIYNFEPVFAVHPDTGVPVILPRARL